MQLDPVEVFAYAGASGEEEPRALVLGGERIEITAVHDRRREPTGRWYRVETAHGRRLLLFCREPDLTWFLADERRPPRA